jgi:hypothetical protein
VVTAGQKDGVWRRLAEEKNPGHLRPFRRRRNTWTLPAEPPRGYRSCVIYLDGNALLSCGPMGVDRSRDGGRRWELVSREGFHVATRARNGRAVYLAGSSGRIGKLEE